MAEKVVRSVETREGRVTSPGGRSGGRAAVSERDAGGAVDTSAGACGRHGMFLCWRRA